eukprot:Polyplicarium_translucidae@DN3137_c0_g1_i2.p1
MSKKFVKKTSDVHAFDASGQVFKGFNIWATNAPAVKSDPSLLFAKCVVLPGSSKDAFKCKQVDPPDETEFDVPQSCAFNYNANLDPLGFPDIGMIPHTNMACVLDFLRQRLHASQIYSTADPLLVALNPFRDVGVIGKDTIERYRDAQDVTKLPPHVFSIARVALENLHQVHKSQTIIVSGESGAGKTEATKQIMRYFAAAKSGSTDTRIQTAVMAANPVLEAFGNAKTIRNNNSSRFGRFMQLQVGGLGGIEYGSVRNFLLEKSRVIMQGDNERSYHIFYQMLKGAKPEWRTRFKLKGIKEYKFINPSCVDVTGIDDVADWKEVLESFESMGLTTDQIEAIVSVVAGVILLGDVTIVEVEKDGVPDAAAISETDRAKFHDACGLLGLDPEMTEEGICIKLSTAGGKQVRGRWNRVNGAMLKDSLSKAMFDKLFDWIIKFLNVNIKPPSGFKHFMGMLDIFGFEVFANNSLEQMFINITNEMLQKNFTDVVFEREQKLYNSEGIVCADLVYTSNAEVINMLTAKKASFMAVLEDQCLAPGGTDEKFLSAAVSALKDQPKFVKAKVGANINFLVDHTIGEIQYSVVDFLFKNKDVLRGELVEVVQASPNETIRGLFEGVVIEKGKMPKGQLIGSQFMTQLGALMELINSTEPHFIRCVKPNEEKAPLKFTSDKTLVQLHALSILEALQLRNLGYSYRRPFDEFLFQYRFVDLGVATDTTLSPVDASKKLLQRAGVDKGMAIGKSMVFMKPETMKFMAQKQREALAAWGPVVSILEAVQKRKIYRDDYYKRRAGPAARLQALARRKLVGAVEPPPADAKIAEWC